ncbi:hypothetical protein GCM10017772_36120 [Promicromonospora soli]|uniref:Uncharacterized protein n=1 Tax=Promicromonospora soli TaxID=2035533 RepID=A0A919G2K4_9MICO|nr:hypothetical protein GCM10017772_36120 [Promicromonospora soli]
MLRERDGAVTPLLPTSLPDAAVAVGAAAAGAAAAGKGTRTSWTGAGAVRPAWAADGVWMAMSLLRLGVVCSVLACLVGMCAVVRRSRGEVRRWARAGRGQANVRLVVSGTFDDSCLGP